mmetsp:Transcript_93294/g.291848  ORF Transcript_93294/g.291848 Transcript_93294/m.291848 type:complete len:375 (+) Transcript_93294:323-1447(+)
MQTTACCQNLRGPAVTQLLAARHSLVQGILGTLPSAVGRSGVPGGRRGLHAGLLGIRLHVAALAGGPAHGELVEVDPDHGLTDVRGHLREGLRVLVVRHGLDDRLGALLGVGGLEDATADKDAVDPKLHAERRVGGCRHSAGGKVDDGKLAVALDPLQQVERRAHLLGQGEQLVLVHGLQLPDLLVQRPDVPHGLHHVARPRLALRPDHARALGDAPQRLGQVPAAADEGHLELVLVDVIALIRHRQDLALVNAVNAKLLEDLRLDKVPDAALGHDRDGDGVDDLLDHPGVRHPRDALLLPDVCRDALQRHDGAGARLLRDLGLLRVHDVHDDPSLEHHGEALLHAVGTLADCGSCHGVEVRVAKGDGGGCGGG